MGVLFLPPFDVCVRSFLYLLYTLIKLYYTKALSHQASSLAPDWILLFWRPRIPESFRGSATTFHLVQGKTLKELSHQIWETTKALAFHSQLLWRVCLDLGKQKPAAASEEYICSANNGIACMLVGRETQQPSLKLCLRTPPPLFFLTEVYVIDTVAIKAGVLKLWSLDQQHQHHLGTC